MSKVPSVPPGWFRRPEDRTGALHYWDGRRWTGAIRPATRVRRARVPGGAPPADPRKILLACLAAVVAVVGFVSLVLALKGALAALVLILVGVPLWFSWRRRRAARARR
jgi:Flp pilus assembly protein TadB